MTPTLRIALLAGLIAGLTAPASAHAADWNIDGAHTNVGFKIRHMMVSWVRGHFSEVDGTIGYDPDKPGDLSINVTIQAKSIDTDNAKRDEHLRSPDFFDAATYPTLTFVSKTATQTKEGGFEVAGDLTMHGVAKPVTLSVEPFTPTIVDPWGNTKVGTSATATLNRTDWGLQWNKALETGGVVVGDEVILTLDVELTAKK
jgi:polyisoprenoid-binding protein YceI